MSNLEAKICPHESTKGRKEESGRFSELSKTSDLLQSSHRVRKQYGLGVLDRDAPDVVHGQQHQTSLGIC